jgi:hypothetical protein
MLNYLRLGAVLAVLGLVYAAYSHYTGLTQTIADQAKAIAQKDSKIHTLEVSAKDAERTNKIVESFQPVKQGIVYVDREVEKKVYVYRDRTVDRFVINPEWVRAYNDSIQELTAQDSAGGTDGAEGAIGKIVADDTALDVITTNNRLLVLEIAKYEKLKEWAKAPLGDERK